MASAFIYLYISVIIEEGDNRFENVTMDNQQPIPTKKQLVSELIHSLIN